MDMTNTAILILCLQLAVAGSRAAEAQYPSDSETGACVDSVNVQKMSQPSPTELGNILQSVLDRGEDLLLEKKKVYEIDRTLQFMRTGQRITTEGTGGIDEFATVRLAPGPTATLVDGMGQKGVVLENLILDGNRSNLSTADNKAPEFPLLSFGQEGGDQQTVRRCIVLNSRSGGGWGAIHIHEGATGITVEDNIVFGSGVDVRGNGRSENELPMGWADGISTASRNTIVRNNFVIDATDEGIMVQGAAGTLVEDNVIVAVSREMLGGIAMIDPSLHYLLDHGKRRYDYRGVVVRDNWIDSLGARIHIAVPMGGLCWHQSLGGTVLVGASVTGNVVSGNAAGYGYVANGVDQFTVKDNKSTATYSGLADGLAGSPPDPPAAFLYNAQTVGASNLQPEFQAKTEAEHLTHLLRNFWRPAAPNGYRLAEYGDAESKAVARVALMEMLGRQPSEEDVTHWSTRLRTEKLNADLLRTELLRAKAIHTPRDNSTGNDLTAYRTRLWMRTLTEEFQRITRDRGVEWPPAKELYSATIRSLSASSN